MINLSPALIKGAKAERTRELQQQTDALRASTYALATMPRDSALVKRLENLEAFHPEIREARELVEKHIEADRKIAALKQWLHARKTLSGQKLMDECSALAARHPQLFAEHIEHVRQIGALEIQIAECRMYDMRKTGMTIPTF